MKYYLISAVFCCMYASAFCQVIDCASPAAFREIPSSWKLVEAVRADLNTTNSLLVEPGSGILVNQSSEKQHGSDIYTAYEHGDADIEFDYMMALNSNSGVYLQGRYEVQLFDTWGKITPASFDNGGLYERWDDAKPEGQKGYSGIAPRQNVSRAPGTWQHMKISFIAPKFDSSGKKTSNAMITRVELNGVTIHENLELFGVTRGGAGAEQAQGPLRIQGDHGSVAFRNLTITPYDKGQPQLKDLRYSIYKGIYKKEPDYQNVAPEAQGTQAVVTSNISNLPDTFLLKYTGTLQTKEGGEYRFRMSTMFGKGILRIDNKVVATLTDEKKDAVVNLQKGEWPFEMIFTKIQQWGKPSLSIAVSGPGFREFLLSDADDAAAESTDPIFVDARATKLLRSFMDIPGKRVIHAVSVGSDNNVHYTYDMDCGAIVQVWRGGFLDATPMWHERGDGSSRPTGGIQLLGDPQPALSRLSAMNDIWIRDTVGTGFRPKGYRLHNDDRPVFRYNMYGAQITDAVNIAENNTGIIREINVSSGPSDLYARLAANRRITEIGEGLFLIGDQSYYLRIVDAGGAKPLLRDNNGNKEIIVPVKSKIVYAILF
jgi:hypothetical protein